MIGVIVNTYSLHGANRKRRLVSKKRSFKQDPLLVLTYVVLVGVLLSGLMSFGI